MAVRKSLTLESQSLDPFVFPSTSVIRFVLLIASILSATYFMYSWLFLSYPDSLKLYNAAVLSCRQEAESAPIEPMQETYSLFSDIASSFNDFSFCMFQIQKDMNFWIICGFAAVFILAFLIYAMLPQWKIKRNRLEPLLEEDGPELVTYLAELCEIADIAPNTKFLIRPLDSSVSGLAFGGFGRYYVVLTGGLVTKFFTDQNAFRAIVLHELAHIRNKDIGITYFTMAVWNAFIFAALVPFGLSLIIQLTRSPQLYFEIAWSFTWRVMVLVGLVYLSRNAVLRVREYYADLRVPAWDNGAQAIRRVVQGLPKSNVNSAIQVLKVHPHPNDRLKVLDNSISLFRPWFFEAILTGIAASIALSGIETLLASLLAPSQRPYLPTLVGSLIVASLITGVVGLGLWRSVYASEITGKQITNRVRALIGLGLGISFGQTFSLQEATLARLNAVDALSVGARILFTFFWIVALLGFLNFFLKWVVDGASVRLKLAECKRFPRRAYRVGLVFASVLLAGMYGPLYWIGKLDASLDEMALALIMGILAIPTLIVQSSITALILIMIWLYPLVGLFRAEVDTLSSEMEQEPSPSRFLFLRLGVKTQLELKRVFLIASIGGALYTGVKLFWLMINFSIFGQLSTPEEYVLYSFIVQVLIAILIQVCLAIFVTISTPLLSEYMALLTAYLIGLITTFVFLFTNIIVGGISDFEIFWITYSMIVNGGALVALPTVLTSAWVVRTWKKLFHHEGEAIPVGL